MKVRRKNSFGLFPLVPNVMVAAAVMAAAATGCGKESGEGAVPRLKRGGRCVEVTQVAVRRCPWDPMGRTAADPALALVNALVAGDVAGVDSILSRGKVGIDDVICLTENEYIRRGKIRTDQTLFRPPELARNVGAMYARLLNAYTVTDKYDSALGKNDVIEFYGTPLMTAARAGNSAMVSFLLRKGANPNVFVRVKGVDSQLQGNLIGEPTVVSGRRPWSILCALTECYVETSGKFVEAKDECAALLVAGGAAMPPESEQGQTALWAAAQARSSYLLDCFVQSGADVNRKDALGMTVADYVASEISSLPPGFLRQEFEAFMGELARHGGLTSGGRLPDRNTTESASWPTREIRRQIPEQQEKPDHSAEIAAIESQLKGLRVQLAEARHDADMNAISGTASLSAQMRVMDLIAAIHERERRLSALQEQ